MINLLDSIYTITDTKSDVNIIRYESQYIPSRPVIILIHT